MSTRTVRVRRLAALSFALVAAGSVGASWAGAQGRPPINAAVLNSARAAKAAGQSRLATGQYRDAAADFDVVISSLRNLPLNAEASALLSEAYFGRGTALQQWRRTSDSSDTGSPSGMEALVAALADYDWAQRLDSARYGGAANNNAGLLLRDAGRHQEAVARFLAATRSTHPARATFLVQAANEYATLGQSDSAAATFRAALRADSTLASAREGLLTLFLRRTNPDSLLRLAARWSSNPRHAPQVADAMYAMLESGTKSRGQLGGALSATAADSALVILAVDLATMGLGPPDIARQHESRLRGIAAAAPSTKPGIEALLTAYAQKPTVDPRSLNAETAGGLSRWWTDNYGRRAMWSSVLRSIGSWYDARDDEANALAYYEAATGRPWRYNEAPMWMDLEAIFPLAVLYSQPGATTSEPTRLNRFIDGIFNGKKVAYQSQDDARIRRFHAGLGAFFASRDEWTGGARGAVFQLEHMRNATRRLNAANRDGEPLRDSPDLLAQLVIGYCRAGALDKAATLAKEVDGEYRRLGRARAPIASVCGATPPTSGAPSLR